MLTSSEACERNKGPILAVLRGELAASRAVLEIGSGTGQHAVYFSAHLPHLQWQPTEVAAHLPELAARIRLEGGPNLRAPLPLDVGARPWTVPGVDAVFSANTLHIMSWERVQDFFRGVGALLTTPGVLCVYGPFRYQGALHERQQRRVRPLPQGARPAQRHPRLRGARRARAGRRA